jgi:chromosome segregation ATPase
MFRAMGKWFRALGYLLTFRIDKASETLRMNPGVMSANYDRILRDKRERINQYKDAIAAMIAQEEAKTARLSALTADIQRLEQLRAGAAAKAKKIAEKYHGDPEATRNDPEYAKCQAAFRDFSSTLAEKQSHAEELDKDLQALVQNVSGHKAQIQTQMRELEKLREEKHDAVATVLSAREEQQIADMMTGLSQDKTSEELRELRDLRQKASASARMSREMAGLDSRRAEDEFLEFAKRSEANDEFDAMIGLASEKEPEPLAQRTKIPES